jgi:hypothetical protein
METRDETYFARERGEFAEQPRIGLHLERPVVAEGGVPRIGAQLAPPRAVPVKRQDLACEALGDKTKSRIHWKKYLELEPTEDRAPSDVLERLAPCTAAHPGLQDLERIVQQGTGVLARARVCLPPRYQRPGGRSAGQGNPRQSRTAQSAHGAGCVRGLCEPFFYASGSRLHCARI